jgi:hypothetical protein
MPHASRFPHPRGDGPDITDIARLRLIFETKVRQVYGFGQWKQGMTPAALKAFPAARLIRDLGVKEPRRAASRKSRCRYPPHHAILPRIRICEIGRKDLIVPLFLLPQRRGDNKVATP